MTSVARIELLSALLPFRFSFGHALAERRSSTNVFVKLTLSDGSVGYGEGVPRDYVTGETIEDALARLRDHYAPTLLGRAVPDEEHVPAVFEEAAAAAGGMEGATRCSLELAFLDACGRRFGCSVQRWLGPARTLDLRYSVVIPYTSPRALIPLLALVRLARIRDVKLKVGGAAERDEWTIRTARRVLGSRADLRVDANCAWSADEALAAIATLRPYRISGVEQPLPADDWDGLRRVTAETPELIILDESLRTPEEAQRLAELPACGAFNIRVSKCGGLLPSLRIARIADEFGITCIVGAQVGESGILSAAGRHLAAAIAPRYVEGSAGRLLLKRDVTESTQFGLGGRARVPDGPGLGVRVDQEALRRHGVVFALLEARAGLEQTV